MNWLKKVSNVKTTDTSDLTDYYTKIDDIKKNTDHYHSSKHNTTQ